MPDKKAKKEKLTPKRCVCGAEAVIVRTRNGKLVSCPNPERCEANARTRWHSQIGLAIAEWNSLIDSYYSKG